MLKTFFEPVLSRTDRFLTLLERIATALEQVAERGPDRVTIHQTLPPDPKKETPAWPGLQPHYPLPNAPWPTFPGFPPNPNVPGLGPYWTSLGSDLYPGNTTIRTTTALNTKPEPESQAATEKDLTSASAETVWGLPIRVDPSVEPGTIRLEGPEPPLYDLHLKGTPQEQLKYLTATNYVKNLLSEYRKYLESTENMAQKGKNATNE
jgi:hypothetical protein